MALFSKLATVELYQIYKQKQNNVFTIKFNVNLSIIAHCISFTKTERD